MKHEPIVVTTLRVPKAEWEAWRRLAAVSGVSTHQYILEAVRQYKSRQQPVAGLPSLEELLQLAEELPVSKKRGVHHA